MLIYASLRINEAEKFLEKSLFKTGFEELKDRSFKLVNMVEMLCEVCKKPMGVKEKSIRRITILNKDDFESLLSRAAVHDRAVVDLENGEIRFYDHDFPGDLHPECLEKL
jgi:hypothetical protein